MISKISPTLKENPVNCRLRRLPTTHGPQITQRLAHVKIKPSPDTLKHNLRFLRWGRGVSQEVDGVEKASYNFARHVRMATASTAQCNLSSTPLSLRVPAPPTTWRTYPKHASRWPHSKPRRSTIRTVRASLDTRTQPTVEGPPDVPYFYFSILRYQGKARVSPQSKICIPKRRKQARRRIRVFERRG